LPTTDLLNLDLHDETNNVSFNLVRRAHRVRDRAGKVRLVDRDCGDSDAIVESRGASATRSVTLAEQRLNRASHTVLIGFSGAYPQSGCAPNRSSNPIAHRARRKHQQLAPGLIENASDRVPLRCERVLPEAFPIKPLAAIREPSRPATSEPDVSVRRLVRLARHPRAGRNNMISVRLVRHMAL
jgi:hypothetical protein